MFAGRVNHPCFSPDGKSLVVVADLAAVSCDPVSLALFSHCARPYGNIFTVDLDTEEINKNEDLKNFTRLTHSRYGNSFAVWSTWQLENNIDLWKFYFENSGNEPDIDNFGVNTHPCLAKRSC